MRSAAFLEARRRGRSAFPIMAVDWVARGLDLGRGIYSPAIRHTSLGQVSAVTEDGTGWSEIRYGSGIRTSKLEPVTWTVKVSDPRGELLDMLETYDPRGSAARADWGATGLIDTDWEPLARGVVADWAREEPFTTLICKTDDAFLRTPIPPGSFLRTEWGSAYDSSIFGTAFPALLGLFNSFEITARGAVPLVNIRYDSNIGYWWALSSLNAISIPRIYFDGLVQGTGGWSVLRGVYGASFLTIVAFAAGFQPAKDVIVSADVEGPDEDGLAAGSALTGAPDQLRVCLEEFAARTPPLNGFRGPASIIDADSWDAASEIFALHRIESARRVGGDQNAESAAELIQSFLDSYLETRIFWNELGQLQIAVIDSDDIDPPEDDHLRLDLHHRGGSVPFEPGDAREVYAKVRMAFCFMPADQKFLTAYEAHDVAAIAEGVPLLVDNEWGQGRLSQVVADMNPQPPADPEIPT